MGHPAFMSQLTCRTRGDLKVAEHLDHGERPRKSRKFSKATIAPARVFHQTWPALSTFARAFVVAAVMSIVMGAEFAVAAVDAADLKRAQELLDGKKYLSAYKLVEEAGADDLEAALLRHRLLRDFYWSRIGGSMFALRDLEPHESIENERGKEGSAEMFQYEPENAIRELLEKHPDDPRLHRELGRLHFERAGQGDEEGAKLALRHLDKAAEGGAGDADTHFALGWLHLSAGRFDESIRHFKKCIELNPAFAPAHFNLASALLEKGLAKDALAHSVRAAELYNDPSLKSDAHSLAGDLRRKLGDLPGALREYETADEVSRDAYPNLKSLLLVRLELDVSAAGETASRLLALDPENPTVFNDLSEVYRTAGASEQLVEFYRKKLAGQNDEAPSIARGNLHFYLARELEELGSPEAKVHWQKAWESFKGALPEDHPVFEMLKKKRLEE